MPKPEPRKSRPRYDRATFAPADIFAVYGERPRCFLTSTWQFAELHHILGRGYDHGAHKGTEERAFFSSIFNCAPLNRDIHKGPYRDHPLMRRLLLEIARKHVMNAIAGGAYELSGYDRDFLRFAGEWLAENPV